MTAGAFLTGLVQGMERRRIWNEERRDNEIEDQDRERRIRFEDEDREWLAEQRDRQRGEWSYTDAQRARAANERAAAAALADAEETAWEEAFGMGLGSAFGGVAASPGRSLPSELAPPEGSPDETGPDVPQAAPGQPATGIPVSGQGGRSLPQIPENTAPDAGVTAPDRPAPTAAAAAQPSVMAAAPDRPAMPAMPSMPSNAPAPTQDRAVNTARPAAPPPASQFSRSLPETGAPGRFSRMLQQAGLMEQASVRTAAAEADRRERELAAGFDANGQPLTERARASHQRFIQQAEGLVSQMAARRSGDRDEQPGRNIQIGRDLALSPEPMTTPVAPQGPDAPVQRMSPPALAPQSANFQPETHPITAMGGIQVGERETQTIAAPNVDTTPPGPPPASAEPVLRPASERPMPQPLGAAPQAQPAVDQPPAPAGRDLAAAAGSPAEIAATGTEEEQATQAVVAQAAGEGAPSVQIAEQATQATGRELPPPQTPQEVEAQADRVGQNFRSAYSNQGVQHMMEFYLRNRMFDEANDFREFIMAEDTQQALYYFGRAQHSAAIGDDAGFVNNMAMIYNSGRYYDDGYDLVPDQSGLVRGDDGQFSAARLTFRNRQTGETFTQTYDEAQDFYTLGLGLMAPETRFEHFMGQVEAAQARRGEVLEAARERAGELSSAEWDRFTEIYDSMIGQEAPLGSQEPAFADLPPEEQVERVMTVLRTFDTQVSGRSLAAGASLVPVATAP